MGTLWQDIRYGFRMLARNPGFTAVVVLILAVGIGANTAVFSVVNAVMLRPLPYKDSRRLVTLQERTDLEDIEVSTVYDRFTLWRQQNQMFDQISGFSGRVPYVTEITRPRYMPAAAVLPDLFPMLGAQPLLGRGFLPEEDQPGNDRVVILSHTFWRDEMGGTPDVVGRTISLDNKSYTVVGVMPPKFNFPPGKARAFWVPLVYESYPDWPSGGFVFGLARLKKGTTLEQARAGMAVISERVKQTYPEVGDVTVRWLQGRRLGANRQLLWLLLGAAGFVLLIACANVASLLLARAAVRQREVAMRMALGASRVHVLRQVLTESLLLSVIGGVLGLLMTLCSIKGLVRLCPANIPRLAETRVDWVVLAFTLGVSVLTGLLFGVVPAFRASDIHVSRILKEGQTRSATGRGWRRFQGGLIVAQIGLSLILLIGATLLIRTWITLQRTDLGFRPEHVLTVSISLLESSYPVYHRCEAFFEPLLERVRARPDVRTAALTTYLDFGIDAGQAPFTIIGRPPADPEQTPVLKRKGATPGFFETLGMRLLRGRTFTDEDMLETAQTAIIDENLARRYFVDLDPIGQKIRTKDMNYTPEGEDVEYTIVGVVSTLRSFRYLAPTLGVLYYPQNRYWRDMTLVVRTDDDPLRLGEAIRCEVAKLDDNQVVTDIETLEANLSNLLAPRRFALVLLGLFAGVALSLAAVGIYGLLQYCTAQQTHDIGIRMALGARKADILKAVLTHGLKLTLLGVICGLAGAVALTRILSSLLYDVTATDPLTLACVSAVLAAIALLASYVPARRAARIDPMAALRYE